MWQPRTRMVLAVAFATISLVPRAHALDLTGEWAGSVNCVTHTDGEADQKLKADVVGLITQTGSNVRMVVNGVDGGLGFSAAGITLTDGVKLEKGFVPMVDCGAQDDQVPNFFSLKATSSAEGKGSLKGTFNAAIGGSHANLFSCKLTLKRMTATDPGVSTTCSFRVQ